MKVLIVGHSDSSGGAARAAKRLLNALTRNHNDAKMYVQVKKTLDNHVIGPVSKVSMLFCMVRARVGQLLIKMQKSSNLSLHSLNVLPSLMLNRINNSDFDIVNLHWINGETLSIKEISEINKPIVMTLHDMWAFCGTEHVVTDSDDARFKIGYLPTNRSHQDKNIDLDRINWNKKVKYWKKPFHIVTPSHWLGKCVQESELFRNWSVTVIPNAIDTDVFKPINKKVARKILNLPLDKKLIGFGSWMGGEINNKGIDLLKDSLSLLFKNDESLLQCVVFGQERPLNFKEDYYPFLFQGQLNDNVTLAILYSALDLIIVPSRVENLPQVATEALSCGCPVVGFNTSGMPDAVQHMKTGYLAKVFEPSDLAYGIKLLLSDNVLLEIMSNNARDKAVKCWSQDIVALQYQNLYRSIIENKES